MQDDGWMQIMWSPPYKHIKTFPEGHNLCALKGFFLPAHLEALCATQAAFTGHEFLTNFD